MWSPDSASKPSEENSKDARTLPGISIVLTSRNETAQLQHCLEAVGGTWTNACAQVVVVHAGARAELAGLARQFPLILWICADAGTSDADLRRIGFERSSRDIVLFLDSRDSDRWPSVAALCQNWCAWSEAGGRVISAPVCASERPECYPYLSVVMPVRNGGARFMMALQALALSDLSRHQWELVIVDDGSTDETASAAAQYADKLLRIRPAARGPGYARNRGFELTLGECVAFINADVMVATDTLRTAIMILTQHPELGAIYGSCDVSPLTSGFLSQYRSLVQRYYHEKNADDACTFCSACGIMRSSVFERVGGYDEWHFSRRQLEDLELGQRIRSLGERIVPRPDLRATHLRKWTLRRMISTEILDRAVPWMRLVKRELLRDPDRARPRRGAKNFKIALSWVAALSGALAWMQHSLLLWGMALGCVLGLLMTNGPQLAYFQRQRGVGFAVLSVPLDMLYYMIAGIGMACGWVVRQAFGEPTPGPVAEAYAEMGRRRWPPVPVKRIARAAVPSHGPSPTESSEISRLPLLAQEPTAGSPPSDGSGMIQ